MPEGLLVVLSGPSGVGKGTVCRRLMDLRPELKLSVSVTTRSPRPGEEAGMDYFFTDPAGFQILIARGRLLEWARVHSHFYGTLRETVEQNLAAGVDLLLEIDVQGARQVRDKVPSAVFVFLAPPSREALVARITGRGTEKQADIGQRLETARREMEAYREYQYVVVNDRVEEAAARLAAIITAEKCRVARGVRPVSWEVKEP